MGTTIVDNGTAINTGNTTPKQNFNYTIAFNQLLFSDPVIKDIQNAKKQIAITKLERKTDELDIAQRTIDAYLVYLRAKALLKVERENLRAIEVNLDLADKREKIGVAGPEETLRWQAEQATSQSDVLKREARVQQARVVLNQLMNRPQETVFAEEDIGLETLRYYMGSDEFKPLVKNFISVRKVLTFSIKEAMGNSPELEALDVAMEQRDLLKKKARNRFLFPEAELSGFYNHPISDRTRGPRPGDQRDPWQVMLQMQYPLFEGGDRFAELTKTNSEYRRVQYSKFLKMQQIELDLRLALYNMYFAYPSIRLTNVAMAAADRNYEIMQKKYSAGVASITDLTQAQNLKFQYEGNAAVAIYDFIEFLAAFDRALAKYYFLAPESERKAWFERLEQYVSSS
jgi:outer membrane protein TolC